MITKEDILQSQAWWSGENRKADEALHTALNALRYQDMMRCYAYLKLAMLEYGWEFHSDKKARRLWSKCNQLNPLGTGAKSELDPKTRAAIGALYHETYRAVHFDRDRRIRRNMPPSDPAARTETSVPLPGFTSMDMG